MDSYLFFEQGYEMFLKVMKNRFFFYVEVLGEWW